MSATYFESSAWGGPAQPIEVGSLVRDNSDPTYGDRGGVVLGSDVYECLACGALVLSTERHVAWHEPKQ